MNLPFFIARRYLFARKSHNVINIISGISAIGMAVGTAALIIILSVYNGFDNLVTMMMGNVEPDLMICPEEGKTFVPGGDVYDWIYNRDEVKNMCSVLEEQVFVSYEGKQSVAVAKGVDSIYEEESPVRSHIRAGEYSLHKGEIPQALVGSSLAYSLGVNPAFVSSLDIYYPSRTRKISLANPIASIESESVWPSGIFSISSDIDNSLVIVPIETMRKLLDYRDEVSGVEIRFKEGTPAKVVREIQEGISARLPEGLEVRDRYQQNESLYRMMRYEKASVFLILIFVVIIIAFNIFGSLSMLIIDKREDVSTLRSMGATDKLTRNIFILEGWLISLLGMAAGLFAGILFVLMQQKFGFIKMPGNFIVKAYPVILSWKDILLTVIGVAGIGYLVARLPVMYFYHKEKR